MALSDIGLIGLAVMGENLALNLERNGFRVSVQTRNSAHVDRFMEGRAKGLNFDGHYELANFVNSLSRPRKIIMMIQAGQPVDQVISQLVPLLDKGDIIIDGGNSNYADTERRVKELYEKEIYFVGSGVSGGEEGALNGPSIMPGGAREAMEHVMPILTHISAKAPDNSPCCAWVGGGGSGHFVKMVHNGIEYGDMQIISEAYFFMKHLLGMTNAEMADTFEKWNKGVLDSYLIEITVEILRRKHDVTGMDMIDLILDVALQKGTGKWAVINSLEYGVPLNLIATAVYERGISAQKDLRVTMHQSFAPTFGEIDKAGMIDKLEQAMYASKLISYAQGFELMTKASEENGWGIDLGSVAAIWRGGCIIRSTFLNKITEAYHRNPELNHLLSDSFFAEEVKSAIGDWRTIVSSAIMSGLPLPAMSSALQYFHSLVTDRLPANMLQAQRDYFGAHMFERVDRPRGEFTHVDWADLGGSAESTVYNA